MLRASRIRWTTEGSTRQRAPVVAQIDTETGAFAVVRRTLSYVTVAGHPDSLEPVDEGFRGARIRIVGHRRHSFLWLSDPVRSSSRRGRFIVLGSFTLVAVALASPGGLAFE